MPSNRMLTTGQVAKVIGCTTRHVRHLIQVGTLAAKKKKTSIRPFYEYSIREADAKRVAKKRPGPGPHTNGE